MPSNGNMHSGHRDRLKDRFIKDGLDNFEEHSILEMLLFYAIPQKDTNELAHTLLEKFGGLEGVIHAGKEQLMQIDGVGEHTALFLNILEDLIQSYLEDRKQNEIISGLGNITEFAVRRIAFTPNDCLMVLFIDNKQCLLNWHFLQEGIISPEGVDLKGIVRMLMGTNTTHALIVRSYHRGKAKLGRTDKKIAMNIADVLSLVGVGLYDYIVLGADKKIVTLMGNADLHYPQNTPNSKVGDLQ